MPDREMLTGRQVADELGISIETVARLVRSGSLPAHRTGSGQFRVERGLFDRWIREQYAETRRWILEHPKPGFIHGDWRDWPIGRVDDGRAPTKGLTGADGDSFPA